jgi:hypothetical protein
MTFSYKIAVFFDVAPCSLVYAHGRFRETCFLHVLGPHGLNTVISSVAIYEASMRKESHLDCLLASRVKEEQALTGSYKPTRLKIKVRLKRGTEYNDVEDIRRK